MIQFKVTWIFSLVKTTETVSQMKKKRDKLKQDNSVNICLSK
jgi:hypothetical protein